jgi:threonine/homoserine/homoserine lactone efflux protein
METAADFYVFILSAILLSLSAVMPPGPLLAATIARSLKDRMAGALTSIGHGALELPLMTLIYLGLSRLLASSLAQRAIGFLGGLTLMLMGLQALRSRGGGDGGGPHLKHGSLIAGLLATGSNPHFLVWWATVGAGLVMKAAAFGLMGFLVFAMVHWLCDLLWYSSVSITVFKSRRLWGGRVQTVMLGFCAAVFIVFGAWFVVSAAL